VTGETDDMDWIIGVDFDNTVVGYDDLMHEMGVERGLIPPHFAKNKKQIRDSIRRSAGGDTEWQRVQSIVYGRRMAEARLIEGVQTFFRLCREHNVKASIISHKTEYANFDEAGINLRAAAIAWMAQNRFFDAAGSGLSQASVYFEPTRAAKIERIRRLGCTHFVDDLEETFLEESFPTDVEKILYAPDGRRSAPGGARAFISWEEISRYFFGAERSDGIR
jgi:hypothetical protein